jgi:hypothetical protein
MLLLPLTIERKQSEWKTIQAMGRNNHFSEIVITNLKIHMQKIHLEEEKDESK